MTNKLSHSAVERYLKCPTSYKFHYIDKIRPKTASANLLFGSALDEAINALLLNKGDSVHIFKERWLYGFINSNRTYLPDSDLLFYGKADFDKEILTNEEDQEIRLYYNSKPELHDKPLPYLLNYVFSVNKNALNPDEYKFYNQCNWSCLKRKGLLIIDAYREQVLPRIKKVIEVQKHIKLENTSGDVITGVIDLIAEMDDGKVYVLDNKSARNRYEDEAVKTSTQLSLYCHHEEIDNGGFIVYVKTIKKNKVKTCIKCNAVTDNNRVKKCDAETNGKRCSGDFNEVINPSVDIQILLDTVDKSLCELVLENYEKVNSMVKSGLFFRRFESCTDWYGAQCSYINKCFKQSNEGLEQV